MMLVFNYAPQATRSFQAASFGYFGWPGDGSSGYVPPPPIPPISIPQPTAHDAGDVGRWYNLAYKAGSGRRTAPRTGIGAEIEALTSVSRETLAPEVAVEHAIERLAEGVPQDERAALAVVAQEEAAYRITLGEAAADLRAARQAFIDAITAAAEREIEMQRLEREREDEMMVAILAAMA